MATRRNRIERRDGRVIVVIDTIEHRLSEDAFAELMRAALPIAQRLVEEREQRRADIAAETFQPDPNRGPREVGGAVVVASSPRRKRS